MQHPRDCNKKKVVVYNRAWLTKGRKHDRSVPGTKRGQHKTLAITLLLQYCVLVS